MPQIALVSGQRVAPRPKTRGSCPFCDAPMIAKCGPINIWHWAHKAGAGCDPWREGETDWHRAWKMRFPESWQEVIHQDDTTNERHIADIKTESGLVLEFQRSYLTEEEMRSREQFYSDLVWVVDGQRNPNDRLYFHFSLVRELECDSIDAYTLNWIGRSKILHRWSLATARVALDFSDGKLWWLYSYDVPSGRGVVVATTIDDFVLACQEGGQLPPSGMYNSNAIETLDAAWDEIETPVFGQQHSLF